MAETFRSWDEVESEIYTPEEIAESDLRVALMCEIINARNERGITQKELERISGIKQPMIARIEKGKGNPQLETILRLLAPLGKTLRVVSIK